MNQTTILVDSDAFVGRFFDKDPHHNTSIGIFGELELAEIKFVTTSVVVGETATVLSHRKGQSLAGLFLEVMQLDLFSIIHIDPYFHSRALTLFSQQKDRGTSYTDCCNVEVAKHFGISTIFSFDKVYKKSFGFKLLT